mmetsp:Transcript_3187/g.4901  ORF Transcript_3187/g.4901 Transcript_3187/m.4901 type:complete len:94 (+) Transcript_3187:198-479(+)
MQEMTTRVLKGLSGFEVLESKNKEGIGTLEHNLCKDGVSALFCFPDDEKDNFVFLSTRWLRCCILSIPRMEKNGDKERLLLGLNVNASPPSLV